MSSFRTDNGGLIDRDQSIEFTFDGRPYTGHPGDTLASALLANGVRVVGRSFKYHRPRGVWGAWFDDPNAVFDVRSGSASVPNCPAATTNLCDGMQARSVNAWPSAKFDIMGGLDWFSRFMPVGFYYKTFMWPDWHLFQPIIRKMAGLGTLDGDAGKDYFSDQLNAHCDLLVVGAGASGLVAAKTAAKAGKSVILVDDHPQAGGGVYRRGLEIDGMPPAKWVTAQLEAIKAAGGQILLDTTAFGVFDHGLVGLAQNRGFGVAPRLWRLRADQTVLAAGAIDRPVTFANNDRPGVMSLDGALEYLARYGVLVGRNIALVSNNSLAQPAGDILRAAGAKVTIVAPQSDGLRALGGKRVNGIMASGRKTPCDTILVSGGMTPLVHLWRHANGGLDWDNNLAAYVPGKKPEGMAAVGAANGTFEFDAALSEARAVALGQTPKTHKSGYHITPIWPKPGAKGRHWIDLQSDVTLKDIELAARENYVSVEHLKRYTALGMANDQGKTSNMTGLAAMAAIQNKSIPEVGTTTFRPPFVPVPFALYGGRFRGALFHPPKRLPLEGVHRAAGAAMAEYGGWLRPGWYGDKPLGKAIHDEVTMARKTAGILDASPLGKIEVMGPDAADFVNFIYYNTISTLKQGHIRYGFMLHEDGTIYDDGVIAHMAENRFLISCSSSHVDGVDAMLERWRQDGNDPDRVFIHDTTAQWQTVTITGPKARDIVSEIGLGVDLTAQAFPHMALRQGSFDKREARIARVSFTGDLSFEISVPVGQIHRLWEKVCAIGGKMGAGPIGIEALSVMRAEKGYLMVGSDTDGETMPHDMGFGIPRQRKSTAFVGDRGLHSEFANQQDRRQFIGLVVPQGAEKLPVGAHLVSGSTPRKSIGIVTSSCDSPTLGRPIALALLERGFELAGQSVDVWHMGATRQAIVSGPCFLDPEGDRLHA